MEALFVGLATVDIQFMVNKYPAEDSKVKAEKNEIAAGGPAANASVAFSYLGGKSSLLTSIGCGLMSDFMKSDFQQHSINLIDLSPNYNGHPVFASVITSKENGSRTVYSYHPPINQIAKDTLTNLDLRKFDMVLIDGFYPEVAQYIAKKANDLKIPVILDGGSWKPGSDKLIDLADIVICSENFIPPGITQEALFVYFKKHLVKHSAITRGAKTILCNSGGIDLEIPVEKVRPCDTLGAGDFFHGAFIYYYLKDKDFIKSLRQAAKIAAKSCQSFGTRKWMENEKN